MPHIPISRSTANKPESLYLEEFLRRAGQPAYILAVLRTNVPDIVIKELEASYEHDANVVGVTGLMGTIIVVAKNKEILPKIADSIQTIFRKHVGILEYTKEKSFAELYSDILKAAELAKKGEETRYFRPEEDSLEGKLGMAGS